MPTREHADDEVVTRRAQQRDARLTEVGEVAAQLRREPRRMLGQRRVCPRPRGIQDRDRPAVVFEAQAVPRHACTLDED